MALKWSKAFLCPCFEFYPVIWIKLWSIDKFNRFNFCFDIGCVQLDIFQHDLWSKRGSRMWYFIYLYYIFNPKLQSSKAFLLKYTKGERSSMTRRILQDACKISILNQRKSYPAVKAFSLRNEIPMWNSTESTNSKCNVDFCSIIRHGCKVEVWFDLKDLTIISIVTELCIKGDRLSILISTRYKILVRTNEKTQFLIITSDICLLIRTMSVIL